MDIVLIILGILGFGAIVIAAYVFTVSARNYVSNDHPTSQNKTALSRRKGFVMRTHKDRRRSIQVQFPITVNSVVIPHDRRELPERRAAAA